LCRDDSNINFGSVLSPHKANLVKVVEFRDIEGIMLLLLGGTVLRRCTDLLGVIVDEKVGVDVTEEQHQETPV
jgi:hypothetical protein